jgi:hypothetical protein
MTELLVTSAIGFCAALLGAWAGYKSAIRNASMLIENERKMRIAAEKKSVIADLVGYRFALTPNITDQNAVSHFNAALGRTAIEFSDNKHCMGLYRSLGNNFTPERFFNFIVALMKDAGLPHEHIDMHLLENVPRISR